MDARIDIREERVMHVLDEYARIPIAFDVLSVLDVAESADGTGYLLSERTLEAPYLKDYDALDGGPASWAWRFDLAEWGMFVARLDGRLVGGAAVAIETPELAMPEAPMPERWGERALLWDIRVVPEMRGGGIGAALFAAVEGWARGRGCRRLIVETQSINVAACRFYASRGCSLDAVDRGVYPGLPEEARMIWEKDLASVD